MDMKEKDIGRDEILTMLGQIVKLTGWRRGGSDIHERKMDIYYATSYYSEQYGVWFFHVHGSPPKAIGMIHQDSGGLKMTVKFGFGPRPKTFYFTRRFFKTTWAKLMRPYIPTTDTAEELSEKYPHLRSRFEKVLKKGTYKPNQQEER